MLPTSPKGSSLGFLHTAASHVPRFAALSDELASDVPVVQTVHEDLLAEARARGAEAVLPELEHALKSLAEQSYVILCTCSTLGATAERFDRAFGARVLRIDRPLAEKAVALGSNLVVIAALESTLGPTRALLEAEAARVGKEVALELSLCPDAWNYFERGDEEAYLRAVAAHIDGVAGRGDVVVLAQASMAGAERFVRTSKTVLSSPRLGVLGALGLLGAERQSSQGQSSVRTK